MSKGNIYLTDYKSKFGTLVLLQKEVEIKESKLCLQIGRTLTEFESFVKKDKNNDKT